MTGAAARESGVRHLVLDVVLWQQHAGDGHFAAADMRVRVDGAGHHHTAFQVVALVDAHARARRGNDLPVLDEDVAHLAAHLVGRVIDFAACEFDQHGKSFGLQGGFDGGENSGGTWKVRAAEILERQRHDIVDANLAAGVIHTRRADRDEHLGCP